MSNPIPMAGEWRWTAGSGQVVAEESDSSGDVGTIFRWSRPGHAIAVAMAPHYATAEQWAEVAPVLAAARETLAACRALVHATDGGDVRNLIGNISHAANLARAAIAKADRPAK